MNKVKDLTFDEAVAEHRKLWNWLAEEILRRKEKVYKSAYFKEHGILPEQTPMNLCYCCEYDSQFANGCLDCPIKWGETNASTCTNKVVSDTYTTPNLYSKWANSDNYIEAADLAKQIAELPERLRNEEDI